MTLSQSLAPIVIFWAIIGGLGASLLLPAMQSLIHGNFQGAMQRRAYALVGAAATIAAAIGPLVGGFITTYLSWRVAFAGEVMIIAIVLVGADAKLNNYTLAPIEDERVSEAAWVNSAGGSFGLSFGLAFAGAIMLRRAAESPPDRTGRPAPRGPRRADPGLPNDAAARPGAVGRGRGDDARLTALTRSSARFRLQRA